MARETVEGKPQAVTPAVTAGMTSIKAWTLFVAVCGFAAAALMALVGVIMAITSLVFQKSGGGSAAPVMIGATS